MSWRDRSEIPPAAMSRESTAVDAGPVLHRSLSTALNNGPAGQRWPMTIRFEPWEFHASIAEVRRSPDELADARRRATDDVHQLLDVWRGAAATEFADAWGRWVAAARDVESGLSSLADGLGALQTDLTQRDCDTAAGLVRLSGRLS